jgi:anti-sigma regulatory factor (Ser/Thr protein kinase)
VGGPAVVQLEVASAPESVALVRAALKGFATRLSLDPELIDDLQMAVSEACNNVVLHAYPSGTGGLAVSLSATSSGVEAVVRDYGQGIDADTTEDGTGLGLPLIRSLADASEVTHAPGGGTEVRMRFARQLAIVGATAPARSLSTAPSDALGMYGAVTVSVAPVALLSDVLGRLARLLAGEARFSVERFGDIKLVVDGLVRLTERFAAHRRVSFALGAETRRLRLQIGPFRRRPGVVTGARAREEIAPAVGGLVDELEVEPINGSDLLSLTLIERSLAQPARAGL